MAFKVERQTQAAFAKAIIVIVTALSGIISGVQALKKIKASKSVIAKDVLSPDCTGTQYTITFRHDIAVMGTDVYMMMSPGLLFVFILNLHLTKARLVVDQAVDNGNARNKSLTAKLLQQGYRYHKLRKTFSKFYRRHYELISKFSVGLKTLLHQGQSEPEFYGDNI